MKKIKSLILATLALAMVAPVFTACSDDDDKTVNNLVSEYEVNDKMVAAQKAQSKKDVAVLLVAFGAFLVNMLLRWSGLHPKANYFYSVETEGNFLLEIFHRWIPLPFLYLLPSVLILAPYMLLVTLPFALAERRGGGNNKKDKSA